VNNKFNQVGLEPQTFRLLPGVFSGGFRFIAWGGVVTPRIEGGAKKFKEAPNLLI